MKKIEYTNGEISHHTLIELEEIARIARGDILLMTTLAGSGHPGGSMSSLDLYLSVYTFANIFPENLTSDERDRIVISHGHTSPGVYAVLGRFNFFPIDDAIAGFRKVESIFEGHVERSVPGVEWTTGNLGQGLSVGCSFALSAKILGNTFNTFVLMGDGEQQKGQISEARRFAKKYALTDLTVIIDCNRLQISGSTDHVMPQNIALEYKATGWEVIEVDGHDISEVIRALNGAVKNRENPVAIIAHTVMGKGVSFMENQEEFHGKALSEEELGSALEELNLENTLEYYKKLRYEGNFSDFRVSPKKYSFHIEVGDPIIYPKDKKMDNRTAFGNALKEIGEKNYELGNSLPLAVFDCDLSVSVKTDKFAKKFPKNFFQGGIQEHTVAAIAGALSTQGIIPFFADFGVFGVDETYNQHRLNDINESNLKLVCTHLGVNVGEDGKTHQCIDYIGVLRNLFNYKIVLPADPNQTDHIIRYITKEYGNFFVGMGRSATPIILNESGSPFFDDTYRFEYGKSDLLRNGTCATVIATGHMAAFAVLAWEKLQSKGCSIRVINVSCPSFVNTHTVTLAAETGIIITYEDHNMTTGLGSTIAQIIAENSIYVRLIKMGVMSYPPSGSPQDIYREQGLDVDSLVERIITEIHKKSTKEKE